MDASDTLESKGLFPRVLCYISSPETRGLLASFDEIPLFNSPFLTYWYPSPGPPKVFISSNYISVG